MGFDPISLAVIGASSLASGATGAAALAAGSQVIDGISSIAGVAASMATAKAQNNALKYNAKAAEMEAASTMDAARQQESKSRLNTQGVIGAQRAGYGAAGLDANSGTAAVLQAQTAQWGEDDALTIRANATNRANALRTQASGYRASTVSPLLAGGTSFLSSSASSLNSAATRAYYKSLGYNPNSVR